MLVPHFVYTIWLGSDIRPAAITLVLPTFSNFTGTQPSQCCLSLLPLPLPAASAAAASAAAASAAAAYAAAASAAAASAAAASAGAAAATTSLAYPNKVECLLLAALAPSK